MKLGYVVCKKNCTSTLTKIKHPGNLSNCSRWVYFVSLFNQRWFSKKINTTILSQRIIHVLISRMCQPNRWAHTVPCHANYCCSSPCCPRSTTLTPFNHMKFNKAFRIPYQIRQNSQLPPSFKSSMKGTNIFYGPNHRHYVTTLEANLRCLTWSLG